MGGLHLWSTPAQIMRATHTHARAIVRAAGASIWAILSPMGRGCTGDYGPYVSSQAHMSSSRQGVETCRSVAVRPQLGTGV